MSMMVSFVLSFLPRDVLDEILDLIESVSEGFPTYSYKKHVEALSQEEACVGMGKVCVCVCVYVCVCVCVLEEVGGRVSAPLLPENIDQIFKSSQVSENISACSSSSNSSSSYSASEGTPSLGGIFRDYLHDWSRPNN